jgi:hypothetical protein
MQLANLIIRGHWSIPEEGELDGVFKIFIQCSDIQKEEAESEVSHHTSYFITNPLVNDPFAKAPMTQINKANQLIEKS